MLTLNGCHGPRLSWPCLYQPNFKNNKQLASVRVSSAKHAHAVREHGTLRVNEHGTLRVNEHGTLRVDEYGTQRANEYGTQSKSA